MPYRGKKYRAACEKINSLHVYKLSEGVKLAKETSYTSFDGSIEIHIATSCNPRYQDQLIRGTMSLPHGTGKSVVVAAFVSDDKRDVCQNAGADIVGKEDLLSNIESGSVDFDVLVTTPDMMRDLAKVAKILGPKGLMPSPKAGTVSNDIATTITQIKNGRVEYKLDKTGNIHLSVGKVSFDTEKLVENITALVQTIRDNKPSGAKGKFLTNITISPTMGPGIRVDVPA